MAPHLIFVCLMTPDARFVIPMLCALGEKKTLYQGSCPCPAALLPVKGKISLLNRPGSGKLLAGLNHAGF